MEILFVLILGAALGAIARYSVPRRERYGAAVTPAIGGATATALWVALTWLGLTWDGGIIWVLSLVGAAAVSLGVAWRIGRSRERRDDHRFAELSGGAAR